MRNNQSGFTLVEMAIALIVVGLLLASAAGVSGFIQGNRLKASVAKVQTLNVAYDSFRDIYFNKPGDIPQPSQVLDGCFAFPPVFCTIFGNGNGEIDGIGFQNMRATVANESDAAWAHLAAAGMIGEVQPQVNAASAVSAGVTLPTSPVGGSFEIGHFNPATDNVGGLIVKPARAGHYLILDESEGAATSATTGGLMPGEARFIDGKLDDGLPNAGDVHAIGNTGANGCAVDGSASSAYSVVENDVCGLLIRIGD